MNFLQVASVGGVAVNSVTFIKNDLKDEQLSFLFSAFSGDIAGQMFVFFIMAVAAAEAAVGLAIVLALFRNKQTIYVDEINIMKW